MVLAVERETIASWGTVEAAPPPGAAAAAARYLIASPDEMLCGEIARALLRTGAYVDVAPDGLEVFFGIDRTPPDLIILDLELGGISGFRVLQLLRKDTSTRHLPAIVVSSLSFQEAKEAARLGLAAFLTRPVDPSQVAAFAGRLMAQSRRSCDVR